MAESEDVAVYLPSLEMARGAQASLTARVWWRRAGVNLLAKDPSESRRLAAILTVVRRRDAEEPMELLRYPYVPSMPFALEEGTARLFERYPAQSPPACLRVDLNRRGSGDPYRGVPTATPTFHGFDYGHALVQVREKLTQLRAAHPPGTLEVETWAWPILWLSYRRLTMRREVALLVRPDRVLHAMMCKGRWL